MSAVPVNVNPAYTPRCTKVWGGNGAIDSGISVPGIDAWISSDPYRGAADGGDIYFVSTCGGGRISRFVIADVAGHGAGVGKAARRLRSLMRKYIHTLDQTNFARALNSEFMKLGEASRFASALLATYFAPTDHLIVCNAGHPVPLWYRAATQSWELLDVAVPSGACDLLNLPLGMVESTHYKQFAVRLDKGDLVLIYTDSLIESRNGQGELLGELGLLDIVRHLDVDRPEALKDQVLDAVAEHHGGGPAEDDETLLVLHHHAADPPEFSFGQRLRAMARMIGLSAI